MSTKFYKFRFCLLALVVFAVGCTPTPDVPIDNNEPETPVEEYVRLNLLSGCGHNAATNDTDVTRAVFDDSKGNGDMTLKWESSADNLAFILSDGEAPIVSYTTSQPADDAVGESCTALSVAPYENDAYHADFQTLNYYASSSLVQAKYCYAVAGGARISEDAEKKHHSIHFEMPASFSQSANQDPSFLKEYMYMYATTPYRGERTMLEFNHLPATFRFVITNTKAESVLLQEASVSANGAMVASKTAGLTLDWIGGGAEVLLGKGTYDKVSVTLGDGAALAQGERYVAYAMALPSSEKNAFRDRTLKFSVKINDNDLAIFELDGAKLAEINGSNNYNWVSGNSYTIKINLEEDDVVSGEILADNRIEVRTSVSGTYTLMYEKADGRLLLNYGPICTLTVDEIAYYEEFIDVNVAPGEAVKIGVYDGEGVRLGTIPIPESNLTASNTPLYSFGILSDVHLGRSAINPDVDFERALEHFASKGVEMVCICGDISQNGKEEEFTLYKDIVSQSSIPVYTVTGNHDATSGGLNTELWNEYIGLPLVYEQSVERNGKTDHFLFLGMSIWNFSSAYLDSSLMWLEGKLEEYRNERCFVITHLFFPKRAGNLNDIYPSGNWLKGTQLTLLEKLCDRYVNSVWFSGHSHWEWKLQKYQDRANIYRTYEAGVPTSGWCVHIPSCGVPITSDGTTRVDNTMGSEGAIIQLFDDHIDLLGIDFANDCKYLPIATYRLDTSIKDVAEKEVVANGDYIKASNFVLNESKKGATVTDVADNYVEVTFTGAGQGFYVLNDSFTSKSTSVEIVVEDVQAFSNGVAVDLPANVGFYGSSSYFLASTVSADVINKSDYQGVQFQTSKSKYDGVLPLTIRIKFKMLFQE
ncbi:MAG: metallophosphoesterase [Alistipes sp.]|nr:metallophosphoesterase [Alistipes sp.]